MEERFAEILRKEGFTEEKPFVALKYLQMNSVDGVYTHGVNRFPRFVKYVKEGYVKKMRYQHCSTLSAAWNNGTAILVRALECSMQQIPPCVWQQNMASVALHYQIQIIGCAPATMHGKRPKQGFVFIGWTNTIRNMPAWGAVDAKLGNNPLVMALPFKEEAIVLDMAMSQYSLGSMELTAMRNEKLPVEWRI
jgi:3-dehydro-L-gulonate 2-dehydrogenase